MREYLELEAQPDNKTGNTINDLSKKNNTKEKFTLLKL
jgi:hypothetical protein